MLDVIRQNPEELLTRLQIVRRKRTSEGRSEKKRAGHNCHQLVDVHVRLEEVNRSTTMTLQSKVLYLPSTDLGPFFHEG